MRNRWKFLAVPYLSVESKYPKSLRIFIHSWCDSIWISTLQSPWRRSSVTFVICRKSHQKEWVHRLTSRCAKKNSTRDVHCSLKYCTVSLIGFTAQSVFALAAGAIGNNFLWKDRSGETPASEIVRRGENCRRCHLDSPGSRELRNCDSSAWTFHRLAQYQQGPIWFILGFLSVITNPVTITPDKLRHSLANCSLFFVYVVDV